MDSVVKQNSILKKISAVIVMITALVFFSFNVFGAGAGVTATVYDSDSVNGVSIITNAYKLYNNAWGTTALPGGSYFPIYISMQIFNNNDEAALVNSVGFTLDLGYGPSGLYNIVNYSNDLMISWTSGLFSVSPSNDYSYGNGIVVPPKESLYLIAEIQIAVNWDSTTQSWPTTYLNGITNNTYNVGLGDYPYGASPVDLSSVISYLNSVDQTLDTIEGEINDVERLLTDIRTQLTFTGTYTPFNNTNYVYKNFTFTENIDRFSASASITLFKSYIISEELELSAPSTVYHTGSRVTPIVIRITLNNTNDYAVRSETILQITNTLPRNSTTSYYIDHVESDILYGAYFGGANSGSWMNICIGYINTSANKGYIPSGYHSATIYAYAVDSPSVTVSLNESMTSSNTFELTSTALPKSTLWGIFDILEAYRSVNGLDDSSDISNDVADVSDSNHIIEESYYSANASAIEATGLSNYRFSNEQNNGIGKVADDFMLLWNALGSWNGVYIFSLTMALATFIMRHGGLFTIKRQTSDKGGEDD